MTKSIMLASLVTFLLSGCATTNPGSGASIKYYLPKTEANLSLNAVINKCPGIEVDPKTKEEKKIELDISIDVVLNLQAGKQYPARFVSGADLASFTTQRALTISVNEQGVLSGINSVNTDKTATIISNIGKLVGGLYTLPVFPAIVPTVEETKLFHYVCNQSIEKYLNTIGDLRKKIKKKKEDLKQVSHASSSKNTIDEINALAFAIASIKQEHLTQRFKSQIPLDSIKSTVSTDEENLVFNNSNILKAWFVKEQVDEIENLIGFIVPAEEESNAFDYLLGVNWKTDSTASNNGVLKLDDEKPKKLKKCKLSIEVPSQNERRLTIAPFGKFFNSSKNKPIKRVIPLPQSGEKEHLCLNVAFAENRTVNLSFNSFGQRKNFTWKSDARGEAVTSALSSVVGSTKSLKDTLSGQSEIDKQLETINRVNTQLLFNASQLCEQAANEGATSCPATDGSN